MSTKTEKKEQYGDVVDRLKGIVEALERGELSLEDQLERFEEGVQLVKKGERLLHDAEKRIEQLLTDDGRTAPLDVSQGQAAAPAMAAAPVKAPPAAAKRVPPPDDDDVPF